MTEHTRKQIFFEKYPIFFSFKIFTLVLSDRFLEGFSKFWFFIGKICILIRDFCVIFKNYNIRMLSILGNDFIACWAYVEPISSHAEHTRNEFCACSASGKMWTFLHVQSMLNEFYHTLSIRGTNFIACWAYWEPISSHAEHARKCLKVEYLSRIKYDFQKSLVTGPWDHKVSVSAKKVKRKFHACVPFTRWIRYWQSKFKGFMMKEWISEEMERIKNTVSKNKNNKSKNP